MEINQEPLVALDLHASKILAEQCLIDAGYRVHRCNIDRGFLEPTRLSEFACVIFGEEVCASDPGWIALARAAEPALLMILLVQPGNVSAAVTAMREGCTDVVENSSEPDVLGSKIANTLRISREGMSLPASRLEAMRRLALLTPRQTEVLERVLQGQASKVIASDLSISQRTVENHRASIMTKTGSKSLPALARLAVAADGHLPSVPTTRPVRSGQFVLVR